MNENKPTTHAFEGFLLIDKPAGITSTSCLAQLKKALGFKTKVGHAGTLDLYATGLLIVGIGRPATRFLSSVMELDKRYRAMGKLGQLTDTLDITGTIIQEEDISSITKVDLEKAIHALGSEYEQIPPVYSALKYKGYHLSKLAREKRISPKELKDIARQKSRMVKIFACKLIDLQLPFFTIEAHVSHGTYIRSLINDIGHKIQTFAITHELRRLSIGPFSVEEALPLDQFATREDIEKNLISIELMKKRIKKYKEVGL